MALLLDDSCAGSLGAHARPIQTMAGGCPIEALPGHPSERVFLFLPAYNVSTKSSPPSSWGRPGPSYGHPGVILGHLGPSCNHPGAMLGYVGAVLSHRGVILSVLGCSKC